MVMLLEHSFLTSRLGVKNNHQLQRAPMCLWSRSGEAAGRIPWKETEPALKCERNVDGCHRGYDAGEALKHRRQVARCARK